MIQRRKPLKRSPIKRRRKKTDNPAYLKWIRTLPCSIPACPYFGSFFHRIEAHHAGDHGLSQRAPDRTAIPLCDVHHREAWSSVHNLGKYFWKFHKLDRDAIINELNSRYDQKMQGKQGSVPSELRNRASRNKL